MANVKSKALGAMKNSKSVVMSGRIEGGKHKEGLADLKNFAKERGAVRSIGRGFEFKKESLGNEPLDKKGRPMK